MFSFYNLPTGDMQVSITCYMFNCLCAVGVNQNKRTFRRCVHGVLTLSAKSVHGNKTTSHMALRKQAQHRISKSTTRVCARCHGL